MMRIQIFSAKTFIVALALSTVGTLHAFDFTRDGKACCSIITPEHPTEIETAAARLLSDYLERATKSKFDVVREGDAVQSNFISVGRTHLAKSAGLTDEGLHYDGYHIKIDGKAAYILGRDLPHDPQLLSWIKVYGTQRAAFALLRRLGFEWYLPGQAGVRVPNLQNASLADEATTFDPQFAYAYGSFIRYGDWSMANAYRVGLRWFTVGGHTWAEFVPRSLWADHPEYFCQQGGKRIQPTAQNYYLCLSNPAVINLLAEGIRKKFASGYEWVQLGQADAYQPCECPLCRAQQKPDAGHQLEMAHLEVIKKLEKSNPDKKVDLLIYGPSAQVYPDIERYPSNTICELCSSDETAIKPWQERSKGTTVYVYYMGRYQSHGFAPTFSPRQMAAEIQKFRRLGVRGVYFCGGGDKFATEGPTYFVGGRLMDDPTLNWEKLLSEYCRGVFGAAGPTMERYYGVLYARLELDLRYRFTGNKQFMEIYTPAVQEELEHLLAQAKREAVDDARASNWIRLAEYGYRHPALIARAGAAFDRYDAERSAENLQRVAEAVKAYRAFAGEIANLDQADPAFVRDYFPDYAEWKSGIATNGNMLNAPFTWDFDAISAANQLPGSTLARSVITRLDQAPAIDGVLDEPQWRTVPWINLPEMSYGTPEAATRMRMACDDKAMYFAFECAEPLLDRIQITPYGHDCALWRTECIELFFDPAGDGKRVMHLAASPCAGARYDAVREADPARGGRASENQNWNPEWTHAFAFDSVGKKWTLEAAIPFASLGVACPPDGTMWRANFGRERHRPGIIPPELSLWAPNYKGRLFGAANFFGELIFNSAKLPAAQK